MQFATKIDEQLTALKTKFPERDFQLISSHDIIAREYRREFIRPALIQLIDKNVCKPGRDDANNYERACLDIITWTLGQELNGTPEHHTPSFLLDGFSRRIRDITFPIPQITLPPQWESIKIEHKLRSIVFECKNYVSTNPLTNLEVYQLFEYINKDQHGTLGILLSRYGRKSIHNSLNSALNKIYGLDLGFRILVLADEDLIQMIDEYVNTGSCSNFFSRQVEVSRSLPI